MQTPAAGGTLTLADGLSVSRMGFGAMQLAGPGVFGPPDDREQAIAVLREAVELGVTHIDTSDYYGPVVPCVMSLHELDEVVIGGRFPALDGFPIGWDPERWPGYYDTPAGVLSC